MVIDYLTALLELLSFDRLVDLALPTVKGAVRTIIEKFELLKATLSRGLDHRLMLGVVS